MSKEDKDDIEELGTVFSEDENELYCPNCGSEAVEYDRTGSVPFLECFQCDHNWIP